MKAALFDFDGVILDSTNAHYLYFDAMVKRYGLNLKAPAKEEMRNNKISSNLLENFFLVGGFSRQQTKEIISTYYQDYTLEYDIKCFPGMIQLVNDLKEKGCRTALITNNISSTIQHFLKDDLKAFDLFYSSDDPGKKADKMLDACHKFQISPKDAVYVGDAFTDFESADKAGLHFIGVSYGWEILPEDVRNFEVVNSIEELEKILFKMIKK